MFDPLLCYIDGEQNRENLFIQDEKFTGGDHSVLFFYVNLSPVFIFLGLMNRIQCSFLPQPTAGSESVGKYTALVQKDSGGRLRLISCCHVGYEGPNGS